MSKGSKDRTSDKDKFRDNFDNIDFSKKPKHNLKKSCDVLNGFLKKFMEKK